MGTIKFVVKLCPKEYISFNVFYNIKTWACGVFFFVGFEGNSVCFSSLSILIVDSQYGRPCSKVSLSTNENTGFVLDRDQRSKEFILAAKFLTSRFLIMDVVARTFKQL